MEHTQIRYIIDAEKWIPDYIRHLGLVTWQLRAEYQKLWYNLEELVISRWIPSVPIKTDNIPERLFWVDIKIRESPFDTILSNLTPEDLASTNE